MWHFEAEACYQLQSLAYPWRREDRTGSDLSAGNTQWKLLFRARQGSFIRSTIDERLRQPQQGLIFPKIAQISPVTFIAGSAVRSYLAIGPGDKKWKSFDVKDDAGRIRQP